MQKGLGIPEDFHGFGIWNKAVAVAGGKYSH